MGHAAGVDATAGELVQCSSSAIDADLGERNRAPRHQINFFLPLALDQAVQP